VTSESGGGPWLRRACSPGERRARNYASVGKVAGLGLAEKGAMVLPFSCYPQWTQPKLEQRRGGRLHRHPTLLSHSVRPSRAGAQTTHPSSQASAPPASEGSPLLRSRLSPSPTIDVKYCAFVLIWLFRFRGLANFVCCSFVSRGILFGCFV
jgi:hypothetical protein